MSLPKETSSSSALHGRWYGDACGAAFAMELIGERWALLVLRELMLGPRRFSGLRASLPGISAKVLTERLEKLEAAGLLVRRTLPPPASAQVYELTEWGYETEPIMQSLGRWAVRSTQHDPTLPLTPVSAMLALRTMIRPEKAAGLSLTADFDFGRERFAARLAGGELHVVRTHAPTPDADITVSGPTANAMLPWLFGKRPLDEVIDTTGLSVTGESALVDRFAAVFALPPKYVSGAAGAPDHPK